MHSNEMEDIDEAGPGEIVAMFGTLNGQVLWNSVFYPNLQVLNAIPGARSQMGH